MKKGVKFYKNLAAVLSQDFFGTGCLYFKNREEDPVPCLPGVRGKLQEAMECAFVRDFLPKEWAEEREKEKKELTAWEKGRGWLDKTDGTVSHSMHFPGSDDWNYVEPFDEMYNVEDIFYNYLGMGDSSVPFDLSVTGCYGLGTFKTPDSLVKYFKEGSWRKEAQDEFKEYYYGYVNEEDEDGCDEDSESDVYDDCDGASEVDAVLGRFYLYHLTVEPLPEEILTAMKEEGIDFYCFNQAAGKLTEIMTCFGEPDWTNCSGPAVMTKSERLVVDSVISSLFGLAEPCLCTWMSEKLGQYVMQRETFPKRWRSVLDDYFRLITGLVPNGKEKEVPFGLFLNFDVHDVDQRYFVEDGVFHSIIQMPQYCLISPGRRLALAAFTGAFEEAYATVCAKQNEPVRRERRAG